MTPAEVDGAAKLAGVSAALQTLRPALERFCTGTQAAVGVVPGDCTACTDTALGLPAVITPEFGTVINRPPLADVQVQAPATPPTIHFLGLVSSTGTPVPTTFIVALPDAV